MKFYMNIGSCQYCLYHYLKTKSCIQGATGRDGPPGSPGDRGESGESGDAGYTGFEGHRVTIFHFLSPVRFRTTFYAVLKFLPEYAKQSEIVVCRVVSACACHFCHDVPTLCNVQ